MARLPQQGFDFCRSAAQEYRSQGLSFTSTEVVCTSVAAASPSTQNGSDEPTDPEFGLGQTPSDPEVQGFEDLLALSPNWINPPP